VVEVYNENSIDYCWFEEVILEYLEDMDMANWDYGKVIENWMDRSGLSWYWMNNGVPASKRIYFFWI
jgi:hypothetical protein